MWLSSNGGSGSRAASSSPCLRRVSARDAARALAHSLTRCCCGGGGLWGTSGSPLLQTCTRVFGLEREKKKVYLPDSCCCICGMTKRERQQLSTGLEAEVTSVEREIQTEPARGKSTQDVAGSRSGATVTPVSASPEGFQYKRGKHNII